MACAKIGSAKADILGSLFGKKAWNKSEKYVCRKHFESLTRSSHDKKN